jgi:hypothetical protein
MSSIVQASGVPTLTPDNISKLRKVLDTTSDSLTRIAAERDLIKEVISVAASETGVNKKLLRRMVKVNFKSNFNNEVADDKDFEAVYDTISKTPVAGQKP